MDADITLEALELFQAEIDLIGEASDKLSKMDGADGAFAKPDSKIMQIPLPPRFSRSDDSST